MQTTNAEYDPNELFSWMTWTRYAKGKVLVGIDEDDEDFAASGQMGGEKGHFHSLSKGNTAYADIIATGSTILENYISLRPARNMDLKFSGVSQSNVTTSTTYAVPVKGNTDDASNLQPYRAVFMWRRTA